MNFVSPYNGTFAGFFLYICPVREELEMDLGYVLDMGLMLDAWALLSVNSHAELRFVRWSGCCHCCEFPLFSFCDVYPSFQQQ